MNYDFILSENYPWDCENENGEKIFAEESGKCIRKTLISKKIKAVSSIFPKGSIFNKAMRIEIYAGDNTLFIVDRLESKIPVKIRTQFKVNDVNLLRCNIADRNKLVMRENEKGIKLFRLLYEADEENILDSSGLMFPDTINENVSGLTFYSGLYNYKTIHTCIYGLCSDSSKNAGQWHFINQNGYIAQPPDKNGGYKINYGNNEISVTNILDNDENVCFKL